MKWYGKTNKWRKRLIIILHELNDDFAEDNDKIKPVNIDEKL